MRYTIKTYTEELRNSINIFFTKVFKENNRKLQLKDKDSDLNSIQESYMTDGCFWCLVNNKNQVCGTIAIRKLSDCYEIRRFFVLKKEQKKGYGTILLKTLIDFAINNNCTILKAATLENYKTAQKIFFANGFELTKRYNNSSADIFFRLNLTTQYCYRFKLQHLENEFKNSLILNPTENIPMYQNNINTSFFEGLYVSERFKDVNDKVIFSGRNEYISFFEYIKKEWKKKLNAADIDLKTLSGLNAHLILFLCILQPGDTILLLPEICGGHFATQKIIESLGAKVVEMIPNTSNLCVDIEKTKKIIEQSKPNYIFVDRSEGLYYEDFSWLKSYDSIYKIFDASQYLTQIINGNYTSPFDMGFNMFISTLHKNYPGPQKGIIAVNAEDTVWNTYLSNAKTYISNTHPMSIANSIIPILDECRFKDYSDANIECSKLLECALIKRGLPVVKRDINKIPTLHIWILCDTKESSYEYYLKLENLKILANYRLLPYELGYGLRIGTSAAVRLGLRPKHINELADIMAEAYYNTVTPELCNKAERLINKIITAI